MYIRHGHLGYTIRRIVRNWSKIFSFKLPLFASCPLQKKLSDLPTALKSCGSFFRPHWTIVSLIQALHVWCTAFVSKDLSTSMYAVQSLPVHRGAICQFLFRWIYYCYSKGQSISKSLFGVFTFFQKTNKNKSTSSKVEFVRSFLGRNVGLKKSFRICLTFRG